MVTYVVFFWWGRWDLLTFRTFLLFWCFIPFFCDLFWLTCKEREIKGQVALSYYFFHPYIIFGLSKLWSFFILKTDLRLLHSQKGSFWFSLLHSLWGGGNSLLTGLLFSILLAYYYSHCNLAYDPPVPTITFWGWYNYHQCFYMWGDRLGEVDLLKVA